MLFLYIYSLYPLHYEVHILYKPDNAMVMITII